MAKHAEGALVTFMDKHGHERTDVAMLDPGASAFLCGYGPMATLWNPFCFTVVIENFILVVMLKA
jgi:hypothetical protein